jgi:hypothetical protein
MSSSSSSSLARLVRRLAVIGAVAALSNVAGAQAAATVCKDGTTSTASGRGACAQHGGVDAAATKAAKSAARTAARNAKRAASASRTKSSASATSGGTVNCADGTTGAAGRGACSHHGGVAGATSTRSDETTRASTPSSEPAEPAPAAAPRERRASSSRTSSRTSAGASAPGSGAKEDNDPTGAIAQCKDGLYSHATNRRGACSRHGGVKQWITG